MRCQVLFLALMLGFVPNASAESCVNISPEQFARELATAYKSEKLETLDAKYSSLFPINILIEHSIGEEADGSPIFSAAVYSFKELAALLQSRQMAGDPAPATRPVSKCQNGLCRYDFSDGIFHHQLYLKEFRYDDSRSCFEIESVWFLDGD